MVKLLVREQQAMLSPVTRKWTVTQAAGHRQREQAAVRATAHGLQATQAHLHATTLVPLHAAVMHLHAAQDLSEAVAQSLQEHKTNPR